MSDQKTYVGDTGTVLILDCGQNISAASNRRIRASKPDGTTVIWNAVASGSNSIGYVSVSDTFDQAGYWMMQAIVTLPTGMWHGTTSRLRVYSPFE